MTVGPREEAADLGGEIVASATFEFGSRVGRTIDGEDEAALRGAVGRWRVELGLDSYFQMAP